VAPGFVCLSFIAWARAGRSSTRPGGARAGKQPVNRRARLVFRDRSGPRGAGRAWRVAARVWQLPSSSAKLDARRRDRLGAHAGFYAAKWIYARERGASRARASRPVLLRGLIGVATMLIRSPPSLFAARCADRVRRWSALHARLRPLANRDPVARRPRSRRQTPVLYLPTVAGAFVTATAAAASATAIGAARIRRGLFSWLAIESVLLHGCTP